MVDNNANLLTGIPRFEQRQLYFRGYRRIFDRLKSQQVFKCTIRQVHSNKIKKQSRTGSGTLKIGTDQVVIVRCSFPLDEEIRRSLNSDRTPEFLPADKTERYGRWTNTVCRRCSFLRQKLNTPAGVSSLLRQLKHDRIAHAVSVGMIESFSDYRATPTAFCSP